MKLLLTLSAMTALAAAQILGNEPVCASSCLTSAISAAGCAPSDQACQCGTAHAAIGSYVAPCLIAACTNAGDLGIAASAGIALCSSYSATMTSAMAMSSMSSSGAVVGQSASTATPSTTTSTSAEQRSTGSSSSMATTSASAATTNSERSTGPSSSAAAATTSSASGGNVNRPFVFEAKLALAMGSVVAGFMMAGALVLA